MELHHRRIVKEVTSKRVCTLLSELSTYLKAVKEVTASKLTRAVSCCIISASM